MRADVIVIGAGISGLACAHELLKRGLKVLILEAQSRVGGRILTWRDSGLQTPFELGAEFIHGAPSATLKSFETFGLSFYDACDNHLFYQDGKLQNLDDFWERLQKITGHLQEKPGKDRSVLDFLESQKRISLQDRQAFQAFVEGFHAGDLHLMSEAGLAKSEQTQETSLNGSQMFRISGGYDQLFQGFVHSLPPDENILRLQTLVKKITWRSGHVRIEAQTNTGIPLPAFLAKAVVVTVPLGVLKAPKAAKAAIEWDPFPKELQNALEGMRMGEVQRFIFHFRNRFWEELSEKPIGFLHAGPDKYFPTWWTVMPMRAPLLTAWQGGPKATEMSLWSEEERVKTALMTLSEITGRSITYLSEQLQGWMTHNWSRDPFFLGAYSYITVGGAKAVQRLTRPFEDTLYFAGEATAPDRHRGTVHGALDSGLKAAQKILQLGFSHSETPRSRTTE